MNKITPFKGLELIVTIDDVENIRHLIDPNNEGLCLICDVCEGNSFEVKVLIEATLDVSVNKTYNQAILRDHVVNSISAIKVMRCSTCGCEDFVREYPRGDKKNDRN